jgi:hypothetical protein
MATYGTEEVLIYAQNRLYKAVPVTTNYVVEPALNDCTVSFFADKITVEACLKIMCGIAGRRYTLRDAAIVISSYGDEWPTHLQVYKVKPTFAATVGGAATDDDVRRYFDSIGLTFSQDHRAHYDSSRHLLFVRLAKSECDRVERYLGTLGILGSTIFPDPKPLTARDVPWGKKMKIILPHVRFERVSFIEAVVTLSDMIKQNDPDGVGIPIAVEPLGYAFDARVIHAWELGPITNCLEDSGSGLSVGQPPPTTP